MLGNAVKFTQKGHIKLTVEYLEKPEKLHFKIEDTGPAQPGDNTVGGGGGYGGFYCFALTP